MEECQLWEINDILDNLTYLDRNLWESSRLNAFISAQTHSRKHLSFNDICSFPWEKDYDKENIEISNDDIKRLQEKAKQIELELRNEHI